MPVYSMTGYACLHSSFPETEAERKVTTSADIETQWRLAIELRSVNSRFLDLTFKFPEELRPFEAVVREVLQKQLHRGKMELRAQLEFSKNGQTNQTSTLDPVALQQLMRVQDQVQAWLPSAASLSVAEVLHAIRPSSPILAPDALQNWLLRSLNILVERFQSARQVEGEQLAQGLRMRTQQLRKLCAAAQPLVPQLVEQQRQRFLEKWQEALQQANTGNIPIEAAHDRAFAEAAAFALRIDVAEELDRIQAHVQTIDTLLKQGGMLGKRLDFLTQELHREANTFGSKSVSLETSRVGIDMKVLIEQMREQIQNIE